MLSSSWLRNWKRPRPRRPAARKRPLADGPASARAFKLLEDRSLLSGYQQSNLVAYKPGKSARKRRQPERLGHGYHARRVVHCGQRVHHRAGHVLQPLWPPRTITVPASASEPPGSVGHSHRRRVQPDEGVRDLGQRQVGPGPPDLRFDRRHHQRLEPQGRSDTCDRHNGQRRRRRRLYRLDIFGHGQNVLYAADILQNCVEMFNGDFKAIGSFTDPTVTSIEPSFAAWSVQTVDRKLYVTFCPALQYAWRRGGRVRRPSANAQPFRRQRVRRGPAGNPGSSRLRRTGEYSHDLLIGNVAGPTSTFITCPRGRLPRTARPSRTASRSPSLACGTWNSGDGTPQGGKTNQLFFAAGRIGCIHQRPLWRDPPDGH